MNKKLVVIVAVLAVSLVLFAGYQTFLSSEGVEGEKQVTINIVNANEEVDKSFVYKTDHEFLLELLEENQEELGAELQTSDFGTMITGMMNYTVDDSKQEYFHIYVNDKDATTGVGDIPLNDGDLYKFELKNY